MIIWSRRRICSAIIGITYIFITLILSMENNKKNLLPFIVGGVVLFVLLLWGYLMFTSKPTQVVQDKPLTPAEQVQKMTETYNKKWDEANGKEIKFTGKQPQLVEQLNENIVGVVDAKLEKCVSSAMTSKITNYFKESFKVPTGDVVTNMQKESESGCVRDTIFTQVKSDIVKVLDGHVQNSSVPQANAETFPSLSQ